jgi:peptide/nickel transport system substrate-binding protein
MWRNDKAPFNDIRVRKALNMAVDRATILKDFMKGKGILFAWPFYPWVGNDIYTPLEKLSPEIQEIWSYNPTKAKQLLTEAGLPNGFKVELIVQNVESYTDRAGIVKNYWDAIGVQTTVSVIETGTFYQRLYGKSYDSACLCAWGNTSEYSTVGWAWYTGRLYNYGVVSDKKIDEAYDKAIDEVDTAKRNAILREAGIYGMAQAWDLQLPAPYDYVFFQPWMKGYAGEFPDMFEGIQAHIWLDPVTQSQYKK